MKLTNCLIICCFFLACPSESPATLFGPSTYEDCVLNGARDAKTDSAVSAVIHACHQKFNKHAGTKKDKSIKFVEGAKSRGLGFYPSTIVKHVSGVISVWTHTSPRDITSKDEWARLSEILVEVQCASGSFRMVQFVEHDGKVIGKTSGAEWDNPPPKSEWFKLIRQVCFE